MRFTQCLRFAVGCAVTAVLLSHTALHSVVHAQAQQHPNLSGFWQVRYDGMNVPKATLVAGAVTPAKKAVADKQKDHVIRFCNHIGLPAVMSYAPTIDILQSNTEVSIMPPSVSPARHIYTDGRATQWEIVDPTTIGFSLGHWEGDTLIVETRDFNAKGITEIPGGGYRTENSTLLESFKLVENGTALQVTSTWIDPKMFVKPHTYAYRYTKLPADYVAEEWFCDAQDDDRAHFLIDPPAPVSVTTTSSVTAKPKATHKP